jgi:rubrerythrin
MQIITPRGGPSHRRQRQVWRGSAAGPHAQEVISGMGAAVSPDAQTIAALREALEDEYRARATYHAVIDAFGPVRPFVNIVEAEDRHAKALLAHFARFGIAPPEDRWAGRAGAPSTLAEACRAGVEAEIENAGMYERLLRQISDPAVLAVMKRLQRASQERHLPAFRRCLARETGTADRAGGPRHRRRRRRGA